MDFIHLTESMADETEPALFAITIDQIQDYQFRVKFDKEQYPDLVLDEPPPLSRDTAPNASRILAAAVGNCLAASFLFSTRKLRVELEKVRATVKVWYVRNDKGRLRIGRMKVEIDAKFAAGADPEKVERCRAIFEDYCVVTQSVRNGIPISVELRAADGS